MWLHRAQIADVNSTSFATRRPCKEACLRVGGGRTMQASGVISTVVFLWARCNALSVTASCLLPWLVARHSHSRRFCILNFSVWCLPFIVEALEQRVVPNVFYSLHSTPSLFRSFSVCTLLSHSARVKNSHVLVRYLVKSLFTYFHLHSALW